jgi:hypothetical protein
MVGIMSAGRRVWRVTASLLVTLALAGGALQLVALLAHGERSVSRSFPASAIDAVVVSTDNGSVRVVRDASDDVTMHVDVGDGLVETDLSARVVDGRLVLEASCPWLGAWWCHANYTVHAPPSVAVDASEG